MKKPALILLVVVIVSVLFGCGPATDNRPLVLLTDFGSDDYRTPVLKGYINSANPEAFIIDGTHGISALDIAGGAYVLNLTAEKFPSGTVFVAIVGTLPTPEHEYIAVETEKGQFFMAPDNGLLTYIMENQGIRTVRQITSQEAWEGIIKSQASHDVCGRAGALIAAGGALKDLGPALDNPVRLDIQQPSLVQEKLSGTVVYVDGYGNCLTNITETDFTRLGLEPGDTLQVTAAGKALVMTTGKSYGSVEKGENVAFVNVMGVLELAVNYGDFAGSHGVSAGDRVEIEACTLNEAQLLLQQMQEEIQAELERLDASLAQAASQLSGLDQAGPAAREILADMAAAYRYTADCATVSRDGKLVAVEPASFGENEGADISEQEQVIRLFLTQQPVLSDIFLAVEGFYAADFEHPVFFDGEITGAVSALFRPEIMFDAIAGPHQQETLSVWAMQTDGRMLYDEDLEEIGRNTFLDPIYQAFPQILELGRVIVSVPSGTGSYEFYDTGLKTVVKKEAYWATIGLYGTEWRLVVSRTVH